MPCLFFFSGKQTVEAELEDPCIPTQPPSVYRDHTGDLRRPRTFGEKMSAERMDQEFSVSLTRASPYRLTAQILSSLPAIQALKMEKMQSNLSGIVRR